MRSKLFWLVSAALFGGAFVFLGLFVQMPPYWQTALELDVVASGKGLIPSLHHPLWLFLSKPWTVMASGLAWFSVFCGSLAVTVLFMVVYSFQHDRFDFERAWEERGGNRSVIFQLAPALAASFFLLLHPVFMDESSKPSVMPLHLLLVFGMVWLFHRLNERSTLWQWALFCWLYGLGLVELVWFWLAFPFVFFYLVLKLWKRASDGAFWMTGIVCLLMGAAFYFWHPICANLFESDKVKLVGEFGDLLKAQPLLMRSYLYHAPLWVWLFPLAFCMIPLIGVVFRWQDSDGGGMQSLFLIIFFLYCTLSTVGYLGGFLYFGNLADLFRYLPSQEILLISATLALGYLIGFWMILLDGGLKSSRGDSLESAPLRPLVWVAVMISPVFLIISLATAPLNRFALEETELDLLIGHSVKTLPARSLVLAANDTWVNMLKTAPEARGRGKECLFYSVEQLDMRGMHEYLYRQYPGWFDRKPLHSASDEILSSLKADVRIWVNMEDPPLPSSRYRVEPGRYLWRMVLRDDPMEDPALIRDWWNLLARQLGEAKGTVGYQEMMARSAASRGVNEFALHRWRNKGSPAEIEELLGIGKKIMPVNPVILENLGIVHRAQKKNTEADALRKELEAAVKRLGAGNNANQWIQRFGWLHTPDSYVRKLELAVNREQWPLAVQRLVEAQSIGIPRLMMAPLEMSLLLSTQNPVEAEKLGKEVLLRIPAKNGAQKSLFHRMTARACLQQGKWADAQMHLSEGDKLDPKWERSNLLWGELYLGLGKLKEAEVRLLQYQHDQPQDTSGIIMLAKLLLAKGQGKEAARLLDANVPRKGQEAAWLFARAEVDVRCGSKNEAMQWIKKMAPNARNNPQTVRLIGEIEKP